MRLKNQFIMAPVKLGYSDASGEVKDKHIQFYIERSKYVGAITPEPLYLDKGLREIPTQIGIDNDEKIPGLKRLAEAIHGYGAKVIAHLNHPGRMANPKLPGNYYLSSTAQPCENGGARPKRMEDKDMDQVIDQEATAENLLSKNYDGVLLATGAVPTIPPIKGLKEYFWAEFLEEENLPENQKVVVIGGGLIGIEIASKLVDKNNNVIVVEMLDEVARNMEMIEKTMTLKKLNMKDVPVYINTKVKAVDGDKVYLSGKRQVTLENVDKVVVATGMKSYHPLAEELKDKIPVYLIGDAKKVGKAQDAIRDAYATSILL